MRLERVFLCEVHGIGSSAKCGCAVHDLARSQRRLRGIGGGTSVSRPVRAPRCLQVPRRCDDRLQPTCAAVAREWRGAHAIRRFAQADLMCLMHPLCAGLTRVRMYLAYVYNVFRVIYLPVFVFLTRVMLCMQLVHRIIPHVTRVTRLRSAAVALTRAPVRERGN